MAGYDIGPRIGIQGEKEFNNQIKQINRTIREYASEMKALTSEFEGNENSQQALIEKNKVLEKELDAQKKKMGALSDQYEKQVAKLKELADVYEKTKTETGETSKETAKAENAFNKQAEAVSKLKVSMNETQNYINKLNNTIDDNGRMLDEIESGARDAATGLKTLEDAADSASDGLEEMGKKLDAGNLMQAAENLQVVSDKLVEIGQEAMDSASEWETAQAKMQANMNLTAEETERLRNVAEEVFEEGIADSVETASEAAMLCKQNLGDLNDVDLKNLSAQLVGIADRTETDLQENIRGASQLMKAFELDGQQALDLIAAGYQKNLNASGDFMDTLNEYAPLFAEAGYSAQDMLDILSNGTENGALNTDKVADAVKELQIRLGDGTFENNMGLFSSSTQSLFQEWRTGGATVSQVAASIGQDLKQMTPTEQQQALSALSSQFEDLGIKASIALFDIGNGFTDVTGKAQEFSDATPSEKWQGSLNKISDSLADVGTKIMETLQPALELVAGAAEGFSKLPGPIQTVVVVLGILLAAFVALAPAISAIITIVGTLSTVALGPIIPIIAAVVAAVAAVILIFQNWGSISEWLGNLMQSIGETIQNVWQELKKSLTDAVKSIQNAVKTGFKTVSSTVSSIVSNIKNTAVNTFKSLVSGIRSVLSNVTSVVKNGFRGAIDFITSLPKKALQWGKDFISGIADGIRSAIGMVTDAVSGVADKITSFLHFSRPDEGPLHYYEKWMPDMMSGLAKGIYDNLGKVQMAAQAVAADVSAGISGNINGAAQASSMTASSVIIVEGDTIMLGGKVIGRTAEKHITLSQTARNKAKGEKR